MTLGWALHEPRQRASRLGKVDTPSLALPELRARMRWGQVPRRGTRLLWGVPSPPTFGVHATRARAYSPRPRRRPPCGLSDHRRRPSCRCRTHTLRPKSGLVAPPPVSGTACRDHSPACSVNTHAALRRGLRFRLAGEDRFAISGDHTSMPNAPPLPLIRPGASSADWPEPSPPSVNTHAAPAPAPLPGPQGTPSCRRPQARRCGRVRRRRTRRSPSPSTPAAPRFTQRA